MDRELEKLKTTLMEELTDLSKQGVTSSNLDAIYKLTSSIKALCKIMKEDDEGYSQRSRMYYRDGDSWNGGNSYERMRDRDGRYRSNGGYSRGDGKEEMISKLEDMLEDAESEKEREAIRKCVSQLRNI